MTKNLEKFKEVDGKWPLFQITRLTRDPHTSKFQITYPNSKKDYNTLHFGCFLKKKQQNKTKRNISYVHPMKRVDEVGQKRTGNNYRVVGSWGGGPDKLVVSTQSVDHDPNGGAHANEDHLRPPLQFTSSL